MAVFRSCGLGVHYECEGITFGNSESEGAMCDCSCHGEITQESADVPSLPLAESRRWELLQLFLRYREYLNVESELAALKKYEKFLETGEIE